MDTASSDPFAVDVDGVIDDDDDDDGMGLDGWYLPISHWQSSIDAAVRVDVLAYSGQAIQRVLEGSKDRDRYAFNPQGSQRGLDGMDVF